MAIKYEKKLQLYRGDTETINVDLAGTSLSDVEEVRMTLKDTLNSAPILEFIYPAHKDHAFTVASDTSLQLTFNHGSSPKHLRTNYLYVPDGGTREFFYDIQMRTNDPKKRFTTLYGNKLTLIADVTNHDGDETVAHFLEAETYENTLIEGPLLAIIASWANASDPSASNPVATIKDLKDLNAVKSNLELEIKELSEAQASECSVTLSKKREKDTPIFMFIGGTQIPIPATNYTTKDNNVVTWHEDDSNGWLAGKLTKDFVLMFIYYSDIFE